MFLAVCAYLWWDSTRKGELVSIDHAARSGRASRGRARRHAPDGRVYEAPVGTPVREILLAAYEAPAHLHGAMSTDACAS